MQNIKIFRLKHIKVMRILTKIFLGASIFFMMLSICFIINIAHKNTKLIENFSRDENTYHYVDAIKNENLNKISEFIPNSEVGMKEPELKKDIVSPITISYYKSINDDNPVYIINKGEIIYCTTSDRVKNRISYRGIDSLPTNVPGWRLSKPFIVKGKYTNDEFLYVKLDDLMDITYKWIEENPIISKMVVPFLTTNQNPSKHDIGMYFLLYIDRILYENGIFLSNDMLYPIFTTKVVFNFSASIVSLALFLLLKKTHLLKHYAKQN